MPKPIIVTGDDSRTLVTLADDGVIVPIDPGATVFAALITPDHTTQLIADTEQLYGALGSDWENGIVAVKFPSAATAAVTVSGLALIELQVEDDGKDTWFGVVDVKIGTIA